MEWVIETTNLPIKSWCKNLDEGSTKQAHDLANHLVAFHHVALMPDCHMGYGMPIGGVFAAIDVIVPNAVGKDIGCGMGAVRTSYEAHKITKKQIERICHQLRRAIPVGFNVLKDNQEWDGFEKYKVICSEIEPSWLNGRWSMSPVWDRALKSLGTLGGGNHFIEIQKGNDGFVWLMLHSGSRNLGSCIADYYHKRAVELTTTWHSPCVDALAFLPMSTAEGQLYHRDMCFALEFAQENRTRMMNTFKRTTEQVLGNITFHDETNIHHNYASFENHFGKNVWLHRKGATMARKDQYGIIPGSMGSSSYIVKGKGNPESFSSCSHGAGRKMSRTQASQTLSVEQCDKDMKGIVFGGWGRARKGGKDLSESPRAYKDIDEVMAAQQDLVEQVVKLEPMGVVKG